MKHQESLRTRRIKSYGTRAYVAAAVLLCVLVLFNVALSILPARVIKFDAAGTGLSTLAAETEKLLDTLDTDVTVYWICNDGQVDTALIGEWFPLLLRRYEEASSHIQVVELDTAADAALIKELGAEGLGNHGLIIASDRRSTVLDVAELFTYSSQFINENLYSGTEVELSLTEMSQMRNLIYSYYQIDITQYPLYNHSSIANKRLSAAIDYVTAENIPHAYLLTGHSGDGMTDTLKVYVEAFCEGLDELDLRQATAIPDDAGCVILYAPTEDITETQAAVINAYLERGGSLVLTTSPSAHVENFPNLNSLTAPFGLSALPGVVIDPTANYYVSGASTDTLTPVVNQSHDLYELYSSGSYPLRMPWSHAIEVAKTLPTGVSALPFIGTSSKSVRKENGKTLCEETNHYLGVEASREVAVNENGTAETARLLWFASTDAFTDRTAAEAKGNYYYLALGADLVRTPFSSQYESISGVRVTTTALGSMGDVLGITVMLAITVLIPAGLLITGVVIWVKRRRRH